MKVFKLTFELKIFLEKTLSLYITYIVFFSKIKTVFLKVEIEK